MRSKKQFISLLTIFFIFSIGLKNAQAVADYNFSLEAIADGGETPQTDFERGQVFYLHVILDNTTNVAGTAFTTTYDNTMISGPATNAEGLPQNSEDISSHFPFMYSTIETYRANSSELNKIYLTGAEIDLSTGGAKQGVSDIAIFTIKFSVKSNAPLGTHKFGLEQTELFNLEAGYGTDNDENGIFSLGDTKDEVPVLVGAIPNTDPNWGGDLSDDFPDLTPALGTLPTLNINIVSCFDDDSDGLCNIVETNTGVYNGANDTGTDPNNADTDNDGLSDSMEVNSLGTNPLLVDTDSDGIPDIDEDSDGDGFTNAEEIECESDPANLSSRCTKGLPWLMLLLDDDPLEEPDNNSAIVGTYEFDPDKEYLHLFSDGSFIYESSPYPGECGWGCTQYTILRNFGTYEIINNNLIFHPVSAFDMTLGVSLNPEDLGPCWTMNHKFTTTSFPNNIFFEEDGMIFTVGAYVTYTPGRPDHCGEADYIPAGVTVTKVNTDPSVFYLTN